MIESSLRALDRHAGALAIGLAVLFALPLAVQNLTVDTLQQYSRLADSFLDGRLDLGPGLAHIDEPSHYRGRDYLPLGPAPALLLVPGAALARAFGASFLQGWLGFPLAVAVFLVAFALARRLGSTREDAFLLAFAFCFASPFVGVAALPISNYFAHVVVSLLLLLALHEFFGRRRFAWIGACLGLALASRLSAGLGVAFFLGAIALDAGPASRKARQALALLAPFLVAGALLMVYNEARFDDPFETGYAFQRVPDPVQLRARSYGLASLVHVPGNLYYALLSLPQPVFAEGTRSVLVSPWFRPDPWGMSLLVTSPWLLTLLVASGRSPVERLLLATSGLVGVALLPTWSMGYAQFGYRFALDLLPFAWTAFVLGVRRRHGALPPGLKALVLASAMVTFALLLVFLGVDRAPRGG
jgi:hypothetical protein